MIRFARRVSLLVRENVKIDNNSIAYSINTKAIKNAYYKKAKKTKQEKAINKQEKKTKTTKKKQSRTEQKKKTTQNRLLINRFGLVLWHINHC